MVAGQARPFLGEPEDCRSLGVGRMSQDLCNYKASQYA